MSEFESEIPKEKIASKESKEKEPTSQELAETCRNVLEGEICEEFERMEFVEALEYAFTCLIEAGVDDPEEFLIEKGILEQPKE